MLENERLFFCHFGFAMLHFLWFAAYYSRYSSLNHKLSGVEKLSRLGLITTELAELNRSGISRKITALRKRCLLPLPAIVAAHLLYLYLEGFPVMSELLKVGGILAGSLAMIGLANVTKGAKVMPDIRFRARGPFK